MGYKGLLRIELFFSFMYERMQSVLRGNLFFFKIQISTIILFLEYSEQSAS